MDDNNLLLIVLLGFVGFLVWAVVTIWAISEGVAKGMMKYEKSKNKEGKE